MSDLFDILEICLQEVEQGADLEAVLSRYPAHADELRPLLTAAGNARQMAAPAPSDEVLRRNRAKVLQRAAELRELGQPAPHRTFSLPRRWAMALAMFALVLFSTVSVVRASDQTLPGDGLYSVKRWWEQVRLAATFEGSQYQQLASEIEDERLEEIQQLFALGISARVEFTGVVTSQRGDLWRVAEIPVQITQQTKLPNEPVQVGDAVRVYGFAREDVVVAERIEFLPAGSALPGIVPVFDVEKPTATATLALTQTSPSPVTETPAPSATPSPSPTMTPTGIVPNTNSGNINSNSNDDGSNVNDNNNDDNSNNNNNDDNSNDNNNDDNSGSGGGGDD